MISLIEQTKLLAIILLSTFCVLASASYNKGLTPTYDDTRLLSVKNARKNSPETNKLLEEIFSNLSAEYEYDKNHPNLDKYSTIVLKATEKLKKLNFYNQYITIPSSFCENANEGINCPIETSFYRTDDGSCNNKNENKKWYGRTNTPQKRILKAYYDDGLSAMRSKSYVPGYNLPHPRLITNTLQTPWPSKSVWSNYFVTFGQTLAHDLIHTKPSTGGDYSGNPLTCDCYNPSQNNPDCVSLPIQSYDTFYKTNNQNCYSFLRSQASVVDFDCNLGPREQLNVYTSYLDLGFIYGPNGGGKANAPNDHWLAFSVNKNNEVVFPTLDETSCAFRDLWPKYNTSDVNGEQNIYQFSSQVIWLRNHNLIATALKTLADAKKVLADWPNSKIFNVARKINTAMYQHVVYNEYIPNALGIWTSKKYDLWPLTWGYYYGYNSEVYPQIYNEFAVAAFRHHNMVGNQQCYADITYRNTQCHEISNGMKDSNQACQSVDYVTRGQLSTASYYPTPQVSWIMNNWLLKQYDSIGVKNLLRGRDHGVRGYIYYREWCGMGLARSFDDLKEIPFKVRAELRKLYYHVADVELWIAGISELPVKDGLFGPTFSCIMGRQFAELRRGDRFYYENGIDQDSRFTTKQLEMIRSQLLSNILCKNLQVVTVPKWPFLTINGKFNPLLDCSKFQAYDLESFFVPSSSIY